MKSKAGAGRDLPVQLFKDKKAWEAWMDKNHSSAAGLWLRIAKKAANIKSLSYAEALEVALCYGWIDGQKKAYDETTWLQKFTPRGARSIWSTINREKAEELIMKGLMKPAGLKAIERAKENNQWETAYDSQSKITIPEDLQAELDKNTKAKAFFATLNSVNRYAILFRLQTAKKPETRAKRLRQFVDMLEKHERIHP
jgi:uncharacterized protein YdeI (YjbR/CyaY-like superfamily)